MRRRATTAENQEQDREEQLVVFDLASESYAVDIGAVHEIVRMQHMSEVPRAPQFVEGAINLRGKVIPVIDLLLECLDALRVLHGEAATLRESAEDFAPLVRRLAEVTAACSTTRPHERAAPGVAPGAAPASFSEAERRHLRKLHAEGKPAYVVSVENEPDCPLPAARCLQVAVERATPPASPPRVRGAGRPVPPACGGTMWPWPRSLQRGRLRGRRLRELARPALPAPPAPQIEAPGGLLESSGHLG